MTKQVNPITRPLNHSGDRLTKRSAAIPAKRRNGIAGFEWPARLTLEEIINQPARRSLIKVNPVAAKVAAKGTGFRRAIKTSTKTVSNTA